MNIRESIKAVYLLGGTVSFAFKEKSDSWMTEYKIFRLSENPVVVCPFNKEFKPEELDKAIDLLIDKVFHRGNLALAVEGIRKHRLTDEDLDYLDPATYKALLKKYQDEYFAKDYPEFENK